MEYIEIAKSHIQYHVKLKDYVKSLKRTRDELNSKIEDVRQQLETERCRPGKVPRKEVENWLNYGKQIIEEAQHVENEVNKGRYIFRAFDAKRVEEKTQEMHNFLDRGPNVSESLVIDGSSVGFPLPTSELIGVTDVRDQIWTWLMQEEVLRIGVWGMGGVGKTTIMMNIHNALLKENRFDKVIWLTVSKEFNIVKLQDDIAKALNGDLSTEGDKVRRAALLMNMLENAKNHVLILDDMWDEISLEEVGIPEPTSSNGCKLVLTTRKEKVCKSMGCEVIKVNPLSEEEALTLLKNKVGPSISQIPESTVRDVVKECPGLPLTITVVAGTLKGENDLPFWNHTLTELKRQIRDVEGVEAKVIGCLKYSFDQLKDKNVQHCFLYCALYPEDFVIWEYELIEHWIEEGFIAEMDTRQQMEDKGHAILKKFKDNSLLESVEIGVKMHDVVRDMALSITRMKPRYMVKAGMQLKWFLEEEEWTTDLEKMSLMRNSISEIPIDLSAPKYRLLTTLLLQGNPIKKISNSFFANMPCLSVLNLSYTLIECLPTSISELKNLTALLLRDCYRLKHLPSLSKLQRLKKLDLCSSAIQEVPEGMEMLASLRYLDLSCRYLKEVPTGLIPKLSRLQYLGFEDLNPKTSISTEEVVSLEKLEHFKGCFNDMHEFKKFVQSMQRRKSLNAYSLKVGPNPPSFVSFAQSKAVSIYIGESCGDDVLLPIDVQSFNVSNRNLLRSLSDISSLKYANDLRACFIGYCQGMEFVLSFSSPSTSCTPFQSLESLILRDLPQLSELIRTEGFTSGQPILAPPGIFSHLNYIDVRECSNIRKLFPHWLFTNLQNVVGIRVEDCKQLVEIFALATSEDDDEEKGSDKIKVNLPKLRRLVLKPLPKLKSICNKCGVMVCDSLEEISVRSCPKLKRIPPFVSLLGNEQPYAYAPPSLTICSPREWWDSLEWPHPNFKNVLSTSFRVGYN